MAFELGWPGSHHAHKCPYLRTGLLLGALEQLCFNQECVIHEICSLFFKRTLERVLINWCWGCVSLFWVRNQWIWIQLCLAVLGGILIIAIRRVFDLAWGMFPFLSTEIKRVYVQNKPLRSVVLTCDRCMHMYLVFCPLLMNNILLICGNGSVSLA